MPRLITFFTLFALFASVLPAPVEAAPFRYSWEIHDLLAVDGDSVELRDERGRVLKTLPTRQLLRIYAVMKGIEKAAEVNSLLIIVDGDAPNAFATKTRGVLLSEEDVAKKRAEREKGDASVKAMEDEGGRRIDEENSVELNVIGINFAMLDLLGDDMHMVAALIGHELGHLVLDHGERSKPHRRVSDAVRSAESTRYSRDHEREADYIGVVWMVEAGFDPSGAVQLQELIYKASKRRASYSAFVGSHPSSTERIAILKSLARRLSK
ncbi:MAG: M48 family metallopeptidase [Gammaproteobacteria bacterium]